MVALRPLSRPVPTAFPSSHVFALSPQLARLAMPSMWQHCMSKEPSLPMESAEIIYDKPYSGEFPEIPFGSDKGNTLWVKFSDAYGLQEWIGKFGWGTSQVMRVQKMAEPDRFFINAGGFAYLLDATARTLLNHYFEARTEDIVYDAKTGHFIAAQYDLRIISNGEVIWKSPSIALDGISGLAIHDRTLIGTGYDGYEGKVIPFTLDLDTRELTAGTS